MLLSPSAVSIDSPLVAGFEFLHKHLAQVVDEIQQIQRESSDLAALLQNQKGGAGGWQAGDNGDVQPIHGLAEANTAPLEIIGPGVIAGLFPLLPGQVLDQKGSSLVVARNPGGVASPQDRSQTLSTSASRVAKDSFSIQHVLDFKRRGSLALPNNTPHGKVFADAAAITECMEHKYMAGDLWQSTVLFNSKGHWFADVARSNAFQCLSLSVVALSSLWLAIEIDSDGDGMLQLFVANSFCAFFTLELLVYFLAFNQKTHALKDLNFMFDFFVVVLVVLETWVLPVAYAMSGSSASGGGMRIVMLFRLLRFLKVLRLAKVIRQLPELLIIVRGIIMAYKAISFTLLLVAITIYAGALIFTVALDGSRLGSERFATVPMSMGTLLIEATLSGSKGGKVLAEAYEEHPAYALLLLAYVVLANITMMGILGGMLVQAVKTVTEVEKVESSMASLFHGLDQIWERALELDTNNDNAISLSEFKTIIEDSETGRYLQTADVDLDSLRECSDFIFNQSSENGLLTKTQFMRCVIDHRGKQDAKVKDHIQTRRYVYSQFQATRELLESRFST